MTDDAPPPSSGREKATIHYYSTRSPRGNITVYAGPFDVRLGAKHYVMPGKITLKWLPSPMLQWSAASNDRSLTMGMISSRMLLEDPQLDIPRGTEFDTHPSVDLSASDNIWHGRGPLSRLLAGDQSASNLSKITFLVANMPTMTVGSWLQGNGFRYAGRIVLIASGWKVALDAPMNRRDIENDLNENGGHAITHTGRIEREDGRDFNAQDATTILSCLRYFLSIAFGRWISPILPVAYDRQGRPAWAEWAVPLVTPWRNSTGMVDQMSTDQLPELFKSILNAWGDSLKQEVVRRAIYYLIDSNDPNPTEIALSSAQSGLELISWTMLVEETKKYTSKEYRYRNADENIRELLTSWSISSAIPKSLPQLTSVLTTLAKAGGMKVKDGPEVLTRMRNGVAHPSRTKPKFNAAEWYDAWCLARHYLQLAILAYIGYTGTHRDPAIKVHWAGQTEAVPWSPKTPGQASP